MAGNTFIPAQGVTYANLSGPNKGVTAGPILQSSSFNPAYTYAAPSQQAQPAQAQPVSRPGGITPDGSYSVGYNGPSQPSAPSIDFDAYYQPLFDTLNQQKDIANNVYQSTLGSIDTQGTTAKGGVDTQVQGADAQFGNDQSQLGNEQQSAFAQAANQAAQMRERNLQIFGGQSSAGQGADELLNQALLQTNGNVQQAYAKSLGDLLTQNQQVHFWAAQQKSQIDADVQTNKTKAYDAYESTLSSINSDQAATLQAKVNQQLSARQAMQDKINAIDVYAAQKAIDLQTWTQQQNYALQQQATQLAQAHANFVSSNPFQNTNAVNQYTAQPQQQQNYDTSYYSPLAKRTDPFSGIVA